MNLLWRYDVCLKRGRETETRGRSMTALPKKRIFREWIRVFRSWVCEGSETKDYMLKESLHKYSTYFRRIGPSDANAAFPKIRKYTNIDHLNDVFQAGRLGCARSAWPLSEITRLYSILLSVAHSFSFFASLNLHTVAYFQEAYSNLPLLPHLPSMCCAFTIALHATSKS